MIREITRAALVALVLASLVSPVLAAEAAKAAKAPRKPAPAVEGVVNINTASVDDLTLLPGIGEATARRIVEHREKNGAFKTAEEIMNVRGIGESTFGKIKGNLAISGATSIAQPKKADK